MKLALAETVIALILYNMNDELFDEVEHGRTRDMGDENYLGFVDRQEVGTKKIRYV